MEQSVEHQVDQSHIEMMRVKFMERICEMVSNQGKNIKMMTDEVYTNIIKKLKLLNEKPPGYHLQLDSKNDYKLPKSHEIQTVENNGILIERLVKPVDGKKLRYVTYSNLFEVLLSHHQNCGHGKRDTLYEEIKNLYANITKNHCKALVDCCDQC